jgi:proteasome lid subunit RPN8/RPN11
MLFSNKHGKHIIHINQNKPIEGEKMIDPISEDVINPNDNDELKNELSDNVSYKDNAVGNIQSDDKNNRLDNNSKTMFPENTATTDTKTKNVSRPKITIIGKNEYTPDLLPEPLIFNDKTANPRDDKRYYLLLTKNAVENIKKALEWGHKTKNNRVEQGGVLIGRVRQYKYETYSFVYDILLAGTSGNPVFVEFTNSMWAAMQERLDDMNVNLPKNEQLFIIGWFHTHPNTLPVFMSGTDMTTQRLNFSQDWQASLVMNPHTGEMRSFFGQHATDGKIVKPDAWESSN